MAVSLPQLLYATVAYADIFDYPLTPDDLYFRCIKKIPGKNLRSYAIPGTKKTKNLFHLQGREDIVLSYEKRREYCRKKWIIARSVAKMLRIVPTIFLVGVTGGLAVNNADSNDDIDFYIICARNSVFITRLLSACIVSISGRRRSYGQTEVTDRVCLNMFVSDDSMALPLKERDLFSAHEVLQMEPLWSRRDTYKRFLEDNSWVEHFLPVAWAVKRAGRNRHPKVSYWWTRIARTMLRTLEQPAKYVQLVYMNRKRTTEVVSDAVLRFHPKDARVWIKRAFKIRLSRRNIPLDNIFYAG